MVVVTKALIFLAFVGFSDGCLQEKEKLKIESVANLQFSKTSLPTAVFDLGELPANNDVDLLLLLHNPSEKSVLISRKPVLHCSCLNFSTEQNVISAGGVGKFDLRIKTNAKNNLHPVQHSEFFLMNPERTSQVVKVRLNYHLQGVLAFAEKYSLIEISSQEKIREHLIELWMTSPVKLKNLSLTYSDDLRDVDFKLIQKGEKAFLRCLVPYALVKSEDLTGELRVVDNTTGVSNTHSLSVIRKSPVVVSPSLIRFRPDKKADNKLFASVLVRLQGEKKPEDEKYIGASAVIRCSSPCGKISLSKSVLGSSGTIFRLKLTLIPEQEERYIGKPYLNLEIQKNGQFYKLRCPILFPAAPSSKEKE